jgi:hypothetical protein
VSSALAIASVTAVLRNLLDNGMIDDRVTATVGNVTVSALAPDLIPLERNAASQLNLFLYLVTPNQGWRNVDLPAFDGAGDRRSNPPLALDLHYLLTAYGSRDLHAEILLGYGMQLLHETPVLSRAAIRRAIGVPGLVSDPDDSLPAGLEALGASGLGEQVETIKIVQAAMGPDDVSKLWSAFQSRYRPSAGYLVTVVLIESQRPTRRPLPVRAPIFTVAPFRQPVIDRVLFQDAPGGPARPGPPILLRHRLVLRGRGLRAERTFVKISGQTVPVADADATDTEVSVPLPDGLIAGIQNVQVVHEQLLGDPPVPHLGVSSNLAAFVLHPEITAPVTLPAAGVVRLTVSPPIAPPQRIVLLLNERVFPSSPPPEIAPRAYTFTVPQRPLGSPDEPISEIDIPISGVLPGTYLVRVSVDGADSPLTVDASGAYHAPAVTIP